MAPDEEPGGLRGALSRPPPGPFDRRVWRSPLRGPWMASMLSLLLLSLFTIEILTGYFSYVAYAPGAGRQLAHRRRPR